MTLLLGQLIEIRSTSSRVSNGYKLTSIKIALIWQINSFVDEAAQWEAQSEEDRYAPWESYIREEGKIAKWEWSVRLHFI